MRYRIGQQDYTGYIEHGPWCDYLEKLVSIIDQRNTPDIVKQWVEDSDGSIAYTKQERDDNDRD